jgi:hypothetical protein
VNHDVDVVAPDHASAIFIAELWVVFEAQGGVKSHGGFHVTDRQVDKDLFGHVFLLIKSLF